MSSGHWMQVLLGKGCDLGEGGSLHHDRFWRGDPGGKHSTVFTAYEHAMSVCVYMCVWGKCHFLQWLHQEHTSGKWVCVDMNSCLTSSQTSTFAAVWLAAALIPWVGPFIVHVVMSLCLLGCSGDTLEVCWIGFLQLIFCHRGLKGKVTSFVLNESSAGMKVWTLALYYIPQPGVTLSKLVSL